MAMYSAGTILDSLHRPNKHWDEYIDEVEQKRKMVEDLKEIGVEIDPLWSDDDLKNKHKMHVTEMQMGRVKTSWLQGRMTNGE